MIKVNLLRQISTLGYEVIGKVPSGLHVRPRFGCDPMQVAREVLASEGPLPNDRLVFHVPHRARLRFSPPYATQWQKLATEKGITIGRRIGEQPWINEFRPEKNAMPQLARGPARVVRNRFDGEGILLNASALLREAAQEAKNDIEESEVSFLLNTVARRFSDNGDRSSLTPHTRRLLCSAGWALLGESHNESVNRRDSITNLYRAKTIFLAAHDCVGLRALANRFADFGLSTVVILVSLEEFAACLALHEKKATMVGELSDAVIEPSLRTRLWEEWTAFWRRFDYEKATHFALYQTAAALYQLGQSYDLVIAIAKGGLFSGAIADALGLKVRVIEIHAHNRDTASVTYLEPLPPGEIAGQRVLLVDVDTISGQTIQQAVRQLTPLGPKAIGCYFNYGPAAEQNPLPGMPGLRPLAVAALEGEGIAVHHPWNVSTPDLAAVIDTLHDRLQTPRGALRRICPAILEALRSFPPTQPEIADVVARYVEDQQRLFARLNPRLSGVEEVRRSIVARLASLLRRIDDANLADSDHARQIIGRIAKSDPLLPVGAVEDLARGRYHQRGQELARARGVENTRNPASYTGAFYAALQAARKRYDVALIVGPEAFAFEPIFHDLGMRTVAINIPEEEFGGARSLSMFDDLETLRGQRVLIIEDDVQSGATLRKVLEALQPVGPKTLGLYLGQPIRLQLLENVPPEFSAIFLPHSHPEQNDTAFLNHLVQREVLLR